MKNIFGNAENFSLFIDERTNEYVWYPTEYARHPLWGTFLTLQVTSALTLPGSGGYTEIIPGTPGTGGGTGLPPNIIADTTFPSAGIFPGDMPGTGDGGSGGTPPVVIVHPGDTYDQNIVSALPDIPRKRIIT